MQDQPAPRRKQTVFRQFVDDWRDLRRYCAEEKIGVAELINQLIQPTLRTYRSRRRLRGQPQ